MHRSGFLARRRNVGRGDVGVQIACGLVRGRCREERRISNESDSPDRSHASWTRGRHVVRVLPRQGSPEHLVAPGTWARAKPLGSDDDGVHPLRALRRG